MCDTEEDVRRPFVEYADDKSDPDNYVRISVDIPGLKKKTMSKSAANAEVTLDLTSDRSFTLRVVLEPNSKKKQTFVFGVRKLPESISTDSKKSYSKVERKEEVMVYLHKVKPGSWSRHLASVGLETAVENG